jgi:hypothetical protein
MPALAMTTMTTMTTLTRESERPRKGWERGREIETNGCEIEKMKEKKKNMRIVLGPGFLQNGNADALPKKGNELSMIRLSTLSMIRLSTLSVIRLSTMPTELSWEKRGPEFEPNGCASRKGQKKKRKKATPQVSDSSDFFFVFRFFFFCSHLTGFSFFFFFFFSFLKKNNKKKMTSPHLLR